MGVKATFNATTRIIRLTEAPDANGDVTFNVRADLYSDGKEDWESTEALRKLWFPVRTTGGDALPGGKNTGDYYFLRSDWKIQPYESDQRLTIVGNLFSEDGTNPFILTDGNYNVAIFFEVSQFTQTVEKPSTTKQKEQVDELHKLQGLDASNPMTVTPTTRKVGTVIDQVISGDGENSTTVTRQ